MNHSSEGERSALQQKGAMLSRAHHLYSSGGHDASVEAFDALIDHALRHQLEVKTMWVARSSYEGWKVVALDDPKLAYFPIAKCASSTIKAWLMFIKASKKNPEAKFPAWGNEAFHNYWGYVADLDLSAYSTHYKFAVVRDPIARFRSFFTNFIDRLEGTYFRKSGCGRYSTLAKDINEFVDVFCSTPIDHPYVLQHTIPQTDVLGSAAKDMDSIFPMKSIGTLRLVLEKASGVSLPPLRQNRSKRTQKRSANTELSERSIDQLKEYYTKDYETFGEHFSS